MGKMHNFDKENSNYDDNFIYIEYEVDLYPIQNATLEGECHYCYRQIYEIDDYYIHEIKNYLICENCYEKYYLS